MNPKTKKLLKTNWKKLQAMKDKEIDYSDIPPLDSNFFESAKLNKNLTIKGSTQKPKNNKLKLK